MVGLGLELVVVALVALVALVVVAMGYGPYQIFYVFLTYICTSYGRSMAQLKVLVRGRGRVHKPVFKDLLTILFYFVCNLPPKQKKDTSRPSQNERPTRGNISNAIIYLPPARAPVELGLQPLNLGPVIRSAKSHVRQPAYNLDAPPLCRISAGTSAQTPARRQVQCRR